MFPENKSTDFSWRKKKTTPTAKVRLAAKYPNTYIDNLERDLFASFCVSFLCLLFCMLT